VDGESRGVVDGEGHRLRRRTVEHQAYLELLAGLRLQLDFLETGALGGRNLRGERGEPGQRGEAQPAQRPGRASAAVDRMQRSSGHARVSLEIIRSGQVRRVAR